MTIEKDDFDDLMRSAERWGAGRAVESDASLAAWVSNRVGARLLERGLTQAEVRAILNDALRDFARFRSSVKNPRLFLVKRIWTKARAYATLRGMEPSLGSEGPAPDLLDVIRAGTALKILGPMAKKCLELLFLEDKTFEEIAEELDHSLTGVERLVDGAMDQLREWVSKNPRE